MKEGLDLESLTQVIHEARTDNGSSKGEQRSMNVETSLEANAQFAEAGKPGVRALDDEVSLRPELATVHWVGAGFLAPRGLATRAASTLARPQSIWSCSRNRRSIARCSLSNTPAACQSRKRRQQVMPLPKPSSCGRFSQGIPVCRTYRMPFSAARSPTARRRPPLGDGVNTGINDSNATHNSLLIFRLDIPPGYGVHGWMSRLC